MMSGEFIEPINASNGIREMLSKAGYSDKAIQYYLEKPYMGSLADADQVSEMTGTCGDTMAVYLKVAQGLVSDVRYQVTGCAGAVSAAMAAVDLVKGKTIEEARDLEDGDIFRVLQDIPVKKHHCIQLAVKALHKTIDAYQRSQHPQHP
jgi:nitrogen fixation protein NifU and related proteins